MNLKELIRFDSKSRVFDFEQHSFVKADDMTVRYNTNGDIFSYSLEIMIARIKGSGELTKDNSQYHISDEDKNKIEIITELERIYDDIQLKNAVLEYQREKHIDLEGVSIYDLEYYSIYNLEYYMEFDYISEDIIIRVDSRSFEEEIAEECSILTKYINYVKGWLSINE